MYTVLVHRQLITQEPSEDHSEKEIIPPGGDPDAGMPAEEADVHGIERQPASHTQKSNSNSDKPPQNGNSSEGPQTTQPATSMKNDCPPLEDSVGKVEDTDGTNNMTSMPDLA